MNNYSNIIVGYDDSDFSRAALVEALYMARLRGSQVTMIHAVFFDSEEFSISPSRLEARIEEGKKLCFEARDRYSKEFSMDIQCMVTQGEPHEVIPEKAAEMGADLIVMGTHGRRGLKKMIMGSVTAGVILNSPCDVLVVKKPCDKCTGTYKSILVPFDGSESAKNAIERSAQFAGPDVSLTLLYVIPRYEEMVGFIKTESIRETLFAEARKIVHEGEKIADWKGLAANTIVEGGSVYGKIVEIASGLGTDLIIMGSHGWSGLDKVLLGSTAERTIMHSNVPVLVVKKS